MSQILNASDVVEFAMSIEKKGIELYGLAASIEEDESLRKGFEFLESDEKRHFNEFSRMFHVVRFMQNQIPDTVIEFTNTMVGDIIYNEKKRDELLYSIKTCKEAVTFAIEREKDSILFIENLKSVVPEIDKNTIAIIVDEEKRHYRNLMDIRNQIDSKE